VKRPLVHGFIGVEAGDVIAVEREVLDAGEGLAGGSSVLGTESPAFSLNARFLVLDLRQGHAASRFWCRNDSRRPRPAAGTSPGARPGRAGRALCAAPSGRPPLSPKQR
jgi:hypothetical protein